MSVFDEWVREGQRIPFDAASNFLVELRRPTEPPPAPVKTAAVQAGFLKLAAIGAMKEMGVGDREFQMESAERAALTNPNVQQALDYKQVMKEREEFAQAAQQAEQQAAQATQQSQMAAQQAQEAQMANEQTQQQLMAESQAKQEAMQQAIQSRDQSLKEQMVASQKREEIVNAAEDLKAQLDEVRAGIEQTQAVAAENPVDALQQQEAVEQGAAPTSPDAAEQQGGPVAKEEAEAQNAQAEADQQAQQADQAQQAAPPQAPPAEAGAGGGPGAPVAGAPQVPTPIGAGQPGMAGQAKVGSALQRLVEKMASKDVPLRLAGRAAIRKAVKAKGAKETCPVTEKPRRGPGKGPGRGRALGTGPGLGLGPGKGKGREKAATITKHAKLSRLHKALIGGGAGAAVVGAAGTVAGVHRGREGKRLALEDTGKKLYGLSQNRNASIGVRRDALIAAQSVANKVRSEYGSRAGKKPSWLAPKKKPTVSVDVKRTADIKVGKDAFGSQVQASRRSADLSDKLKHAADAVEAQRVGSRLGVDWGNVDFQPSDLAKGMEVEKEHNVGNTDVVGDVPEDTAKIALAHLKEGSDYYDRLHEMEQRMEKGGAGGKFLNKPGGVAGFTSDKEQSPGDAVRAAIRSHIKKHHRNSEYSKEFLDAAKEKAQIPDREMDEKVKEGVVGPKELARRIAPKASHQIGEAVRAITGKATKGEAAKGEAVKKMRGDVDVLMKRLKGKEETLAATKGDADKLRRLAKGTAITAGVGIPASFLAGVGLAARPPSR